MAGKKKKKGDKRKNKNFSYLTFAAIILLILIALIVLWPDKKEEIAIKEGNSNELSYIINSCFSYVQTSLRKEFCAYRLMNGELINCRDPRILDSLASQGVDINLPSLNCRSIDNYSFRKNACETLASGKPETVISNSTCADYR